jgi:hypothetical protein
MFVSALEGRDGLPVFAVQFHPESVQFMPQVTNSPAEGSIHLECAQFTRRVINIHPQRVFKINPESVKFNQRVKFTRRVKFNQRVWNSPDGVCSIFTWRMFNIHVECVKFTRRV